MTDSPTVEFGELPPDPRGGGGERVNPIVKVLKERPGQWARVLTELRPGTASSYRSRLKAKGCEVTARNTTSPNGVDLWARWPEGGVDA